MPGSRTRDIVVSGVHFDDERDKVPKPFQCSLFDLFGDEHEARGEKHGTAGYSPVDYLPGATRGLEGVARVNLLGLDFDHLSRGDSQQLERALAGYGYVRHSTFSHGNDGPDDNCSRVLMTISRSMSPDEFELVRAEILREVGVQADENASDPSRLWYFPACPPSCLSRSFIEYHDGEPIPVDTVLAMAAAHAKGASQSVPAQVATDSSDALRRRLSRLKKVEQRELLRPVLDGEPFAASGSRNATCWRIVATIAATAPRSSPNAIVELMGPSIAAMAAGEPEGALTIAQVREMAERALADADAGLLRGDEVEVAEELLATLQRSGTVVSDRGGFFQYTASTGLWQPRSTEDLSRIVQGFAGRAVVGGEEPRPLRVGARTVAGAISLATHRVAAPGFFAAARPGVAFANGFVEVTPAGVLLRPHGPDTRATFGFDFPYDPSARLDHFDQFLHDVFLGDLDADAKRALILEFVGACLVGAATSQAKALVLVGGGRNGKSTLIRIVEALFPASVREAIPPQFFDQEYYRAKLEGVRLNSVSELPKAEILRAESLKAIIAGDPIVGRVIRNEPRTIRPVAGHLFAANALPTTDDLSHAFWSRFLVVRFNRVFRESEQDKTLADRIIAEELPGIAAWAIEGARRLLQRDPARYTVPASHAEALAEWRGRADQVAQFVDEMCTPTEVLSERASGSDLYRVYRAWADENGHRRLTNANFADRLRSLGIESAKPGSTRFYAVRLKHSSRPFTGSFRTDGTHRTTTGHPPANPPDDDSRNRPN